MSNFDDVPITTPDKDRFGFDPFAKAISDCIRSVADALRLPARRCGGIC
jgi:hypothetical protein